MLVLRLGELHEDDCVELSTTNDWLPLEEFTDDSLDGMELRCCPRCIDGPTGLVSTSEIPHREERVERSPEPETAQRAVPQR